jgi:hypothetical protein
MGIKHAIEDELVFDPDSGSKSDMSHLGVDRQSKRSGNERKKWGLGIIIFVAVLVVMLISLALPTFNVIAPKADQMKATSNCRQIIMAMKAYAADHNGKYPTGRTANEVFQELVRADILQDERVFGCPLSCYMPDNDVGLAPDFNKAVGPGENHWMVVDGLRDDALAYTPVVFENALEATWPPVWDGSPYVGIRKRGQSWKRGKIVIGLNDNSVVMEKLGGADLRRQMVQPGPDGKSIFDLVPKAVVLDIEE